MFFLKNECNSEFTRILFNSWNPFLINCNTKGHSHLQISTWLLQSQSTCWPLPCLWWHMVAPISSQVFCASSFQTWKYRGRGGGEAANVLRALEKPIRQKSDTAEGTCFAVTTDFCSRNQRIPVPKGWCRKGWEWEDREAAKTSRNSSLGKSRTYCYQTAACPVPATGGHTTFHHSRAPLCIWHQELTLEP